MQAIEIILECCTILKTLNHLVAYAVISEKSAAGFDVHVYWHVVYVDQKEDRSQEGSLRYFWGDWKMAVSGFAKTPAR